LKRVLASRAFQTATADEERRVAPPHAGVEPDAASRGASEAERAVGRTVGVAVEEVGQLHLPLEAAERPRLGEGHADDPCADLIPLLSDLDEVLLAGQSPEVTQVDEERRLAGADRGEAVAVARGVDDLELVGERVAERERHASRLLNGCTREHQRAWR
jgi:hypothetical protein